MINNIKVGKAITVLRKRQKLTQKDLADKLSVSDKAISKWERGLGLPDISLLSTLSMILDTDMESLLEGNTTYKNNNWIGYLDLSNNKININEIIHDKPLFVYLISYLMLAGVKEINIKCNKVNKKTINEVIKNINIDIKYIDNINEIVDTNIVVINKTFFIYGQNFTRSCQKAMERKDGITVLSLPEQSINNCSIIYDSHHKVISNTSNALETPYKYNALPIMFYPKGYKEYIKKDINTLIEKEILYTEPMFRGIIYIPINNKSDIKDSGDIVRIVQKRDYLISDLKEIELRRGLR